MKSLRATSSGTRGCVSLAWVAALTIAAVGAACPEALAKGGTAWTSPVAISPTNQPDPTRGAQLNAVAVNASGLAIAAWDQYNYNAPGGATIGVAVQSGGRWGAPFTISGTTGYSMTPSVAVGPDGTMAVSWTYQDPSGTTPVQRQRIQVAVKHASASNWTMSTLDEGVVGGVAVIPLVPLAVDAKGHVTAAWTLWDAASGRHVVKAATLPGSGDAWPAPTPLSGTDDGLYLSLAVRPEDGRAAVAYSLSPYTSYASGTSIRFVSKAPGASWTTPMTVSEVMNSSVGYVSGPQVALDVYGRATVIYFGYGVEAVRQTSADGVAWTKPATVIAASNPGSSYLGYELAVDDAGSATVACSIFDAAVGANRASVWVSRGLPSGTWTWSPAQRITDPSVPVDAYATRIATSPDGSLTMVGWIDHYHGTVQVSRWTGTTWGPAETIGRGTAFSSFQEILGLKVGSSTSAVAIWKNTAKGGTRTMAAGYR